MTNIDPRYERYHRQLILPGFGAVAQQKLADSRVLVAGAGGLGCPVLMVLAGAGVGTIGIADPGSVELSNLHRQLLYDMQDIGRPKVDCASKRLSAMNPDIEVQTFKVNLDNHNAFDIINDFDLVIDGTDNFQTRYMLNDACWLLGKPLIYGAVSRFEGQVAVFHQGISYRDIFPTPPQEGEVANCSEAGVLGVLPGIIGHWMANECIKLITGVGEVLTGKLMTYSALNNQSWLIDITANEEAGKLMPQDHAAFGQMDYPLLCGMTNEASIDTTVFQSMVQDDRVRVVDVRELHEQPVLNIPHQRIPLGELEFAAGLTGDAPVIFICQTGKRSLRAVALYQAKHPSNQKIYSLAGGINALAGKGFIAD